MDGAFHAVEFEPTATANDVIEIIKNRIGLRSGAQGFALYEVLGDVERSLVADEKLSDVMGKWERYRFANLFIFFNFFNLIISNLEQKT